MGRTVANRWGAFLCTLISFAEYSCVSRQMASAHRNRFIADMQMHKKQVLSKGLN